MKKQMKPIPNENSDIMKKILKHLQIVEALAILGIIGFGVGFLGEIIILTLIYGKGV